MAVDRIARDGGPTLYRLRTDELTLVFVPEVGGRLISLEADGREILWRNPRLLDPDLNWVLPVGDWPDGSSMASWPNLGGSKTWPAPQGWSDEEREWAGPPDAVLDGGAYEWSVVQEAHATTVTMSSAFDVRTGLRIVRRFDVPHTGRAFTETITFANESDRPRTWSMWEVVQVDTSAVVRGAAADVVVTTADRNVVDLGTYRGERIWTREGGRVSVPVIGGVTKWGFPSAQGSIAYCEEGRALLELAFVPNPHGGYPDRGSRAELWMQSPQAEPIEQLEGLQPDSWLVELEVLSPLVTLTPGESSTLEVGWRV